MWDFEQLHVQKQILAELAAIRGLLESQVEETEEPEQPSRFPFPQYDDGRRVGSVGIDPR